MCCRGIVGWGDDEVCDGEEGPDRGEDEEVDLRGGPVPCPVIRGYRLC